MNLKTEYKAVLPVLFVLSLGGVVFAQGATGPAEQTPGANDDAAGAGTPEPQQQPGGMMGPQDGSGMGPGRGGMMGPQDGSGMGPGRGGMMGPQDGSGMGPGRGGMMGPQNGSGMGPGRGGMMGPQDGSGTGPGRGGMMGPQDGSGVDGGTKGQRGASGPAPADREPGFRYLDRDGDGQVSQAEIAAHQRLIGQLHDHWDEADTDHDGTVDRAEFARFRERMESAGR